MRKNRIKTRSVIFSFVIFLLFTTFLFNNGFVNQTKDSFNVKVSVRPNNSSNYICEFYITDVNTGKLIANPKVICKDSEKAAINIKSETEIRANVLIMNDLKTVDYSINIFRDKTVLFSQEANIRF